jgi:hypothetical protein
MFSLNVRDQGSHPYKTTGTIVVLHIVIYKFSLEQAMKAQRGSTGIALLFL